MKRIMDNAIALMVVIIVLFLVIPLPKPPAGPKNGSGR